MKIGFIGQGYVGKHYADDFEERGFSVERYALEEAYRHNKEAAYACDMIFIAVPTPTTSEGFDGSIVESAINPAKEGTIVIIKSTVTPGTTKRLQKAYPHLTILFSPEFLREANAAYDAAHPYSNIIGIPEEGGRHKEAAEKVLAVLPEAPYATICGSTEAELTKYAQNVSGFIDILAFNLLYDIAQAFGAEWEQIKRSLEADPNIPSRFANPVHKEGRGAGGHCLIKDFATFREMFETHLPEDHRSLALLRALEEKNLELLIRSGKSVDLAEGVYGKEIVNRVRER